MLHRSKVLNILQYRASTHFRATKTSLSISSHNSEFHDKLDHQVSAQSEGTAAKYNTLLAQVASDKATRMVCTKTVDSTVVRSLWELPQYNGYEISPSWWHTTKIQYKTLRT